MRNVHIGPGIFDTYQDCCYGRESSDREVKAMQIWSWLRSLVGEIGLGWAEIPLAVSVTSRIHNGSQQPQREEEYRIRCFYF